MAITLHRCKNEWIKLGGHPCWRVQKALEEAGIDYEVDRLPWPGNRDETERRTGQKKYPWIEFDEGSIYREESKDMAERIRAGKHEEAPRLRAPAA
jgi:glutathione S-transferase